MCRHFEMIDAKEREHLKQELISKGKADLEGFVEMFLDLLERV